jgi:ribonuclease-3
MNLTALETALGYRFADKAIIKEALTHRSYLNENPAWGLPHNERLEFLGDAVLELIVTEELYNRLPETDEGKLTALRAALVNYQFLAKIAESIGLEKAVLLSRGEARDTGRAREVILANAIEAVIGALYRDGGYEATKKFVAAAIMPHLHDIMETGAYKDAKSMLQEKLQAKLKITPSYRVLDEMGPEHNKMFRVGAYWDGVLQGEGEGYSKQDAEIAAAKAALDKLEK